MGLKFCEDYAKVKTCVSKTGFDGQWRELQHGQKQYRTAKGAVLNWWTSTGTITFQGDKAAAKELEQVFIAVASAKGRLEPGDTKNLRDLHEENDILRKLIDVVLIEDALLKKRLSRGR
jgi:hypothetical protein